MNRYKITNKFSQPCLNLCFKHLTNPDITKHVIVSEGALISLIKAPDRQHILEPITDQEELNKMIYRGRILNIKHKIQPQYFRLGEHPYDYDYYMNNPDGIMTYIILDTSKDGSRSIIEIAVDNFLLDINVLDYDYKLDDPLPVEAHALVVIRDDQLIDHQVYNKPIIYYTSKDIKEDNNE